MFTVCGKKVDIEEIGLGEYLDSNGYNRQTIAVECNEEMCKHILHSPGFCNKKAARRNYTRGGVPLRAAHASLL